MDTWLELLVVIAALAVGYVFGIRQASTRMSLPELARLWEQHLAAAPPPDMQDEAARESYRRGLTDMGRALVVGDPPPSES